MRPAPWKVVGPGALDLHRGGLAPAYAPDDGTFTLYNDYGEGQALWVAGPPDPAPAEAVGLWRSGSGPGSPRALAPPEPVEGYGVFTFPYGPVSMGVPESGRFDLRTYGERVLGLMPYGGFKSRRIRQSVVGLSVEDAALRVERIAGHLSASHTVAFRTACEIAEGRGVSTEELWVRALAQELQRIYNHVHVLARIAEAASQNVGLAQAHAIAEEVLRLQGRAFGHRWVFGGLVPGSPLRRLDRDDRARLVPELHRTDDRFEELWELFLESRTFVDRIQATCPVDRHAAQRWGAVGPTLRACGVAWDDRLRQPLPPYDDLYLELPRETEGDALARVVVRAEEVRASFLLLEQLLTRWPTPGATTDPPWPAIGRGRGLARVEAPSGDLVYDVQVVDGRVADLGMRTPSQANWPVFAHGLTGGVFTDFHFAFESFGLSFAETDG